MGVTICGVSAWQYHRTPPILRGLELEEEALLEYIGQRDATRARLMRRLLRLRDNAREADRLVCGRLTTDLKGIALPVHVIVDGGASSHPSTLTIPHRGDGRGLAGSRIPLGGGLFVLTPEATLSDMAGSLGYVRTAMLAFEACGIFAIAPVGMRLACAQAQLVGQGILSRDAPFAPVIRGHRDERGLALPFVDARGRDFPWNPSFLRSGTISDLWSRPPLTSVERLRDFARSVGLGSRNALVRALPLVRDGAASPLEVKANLLLCSGSWNGGESWGDPHLNRRIALSPGARALAHTPFCVADCLWPENHAVLEVLGEAYHSDEYGFKLASGRTAALESMGYKVAEIINEQMADLSLLDALLPSLAEKLGFSYVAPSVAFLRRRDRLHRELFRRRFEPEVVNL